MRRRKEKTGRRRQEAWEEMDEDRQGAEAGDEREENEQRGVERNEAME